MKNTNAFNALSESIDLFASRGDRFLNGLCEKEDFETAISLACFWAAFYKSSFPIELNEIKIAEEQKGRRKKLGQFFTPPYIAEFIVKQTIGPIIDNIEKSDSKNKLEAIYKLKICDPAMGAGIFLVKAHDYLVERCIKISKARSTEKLTNISKRCLRCVYGVDIDGQAVEIAKISLHLNHAKHCVKNKAAEYERL